MALFKSPVSLESLKRRRAAADKIVQTFVRSDSAHQVFAIALLFLLPDLTLQVTMNGRIQARLKEKVASSAIEVGLFADCLEETDSSLAALLPAFLRTDIYVLVGGSHFKTCKRILELQDLHSKQFSVEMRDESHDENSDEADGVGVGCCPLLWGRAQPSGNSNDACFEIDLGDGAVAVVERSELALLWQFRVAGPNLKVRREGEKTPFKQLNRYSLSNAKVIQPGDPTLVVMREI
jgi:hypothetical protein